MRSILMLTALATAVAWTTPVLAEDAPPAAGHAEMKKEKHRGPMTRAEAIEASKQRTAKLEKMTDAEWKERRDTRKQRQAERLKKKEEKMERRAAKAKAAEEAKPAAGAAE